MALESSNHRPNLRMRRRFRSVEFPSYSNAGSASIIPAALYLAIVAHAGAGPLQTQNQVAAVIHAHNLQLQSFRAGAGPAPVARRTGATGTLGRRRTGPAGLAGTFRGRRTGPKRLAVALSRSPAGKMRIYVRPHGDTILSPARRRAVVSYAGASASVLFSPKCDII